MIGIALEPCIRDIIAGTVPLEEVEKIYCPVDFSHSSRAALFIEGCMQNEWASAPERGKEILLQLIAKGKIKKFSPKDDGYPTVGGEAYWANSDDQITWRHV